MAVDYPTARRLEVIVDEMVAEEAGRLGLTRHDIAETRNTVLQEMLKEVEGSSAMRQMPPELTPTTVPVSEWARNNIGASDAFWVSGLIYDPDDNAIREASEEELEALGWSCVNHDSTPEESGYADDMPGMTIDQWGEWVDDLARETREIYGDE